MITTHLSKFGLSYKRIIDSFDIQMLTTRQVFFFFYDSLSSVNIEKYMLNLKLKVTFFIFKLIKVFNFLSDLKKVTC